MKRCKQLENAVKLILLKKGSPLAYFIKAPNPLIPVAIFTKTPKENIGTEYSFRNWYYVTVKVKLSATVTLKLICLNTEYLVTLVDKNFLLF